MKALVETTTHVLSLAIAKFRNRIALTCSFGGPSGIVLLDLVHHIDKHVPVFYLDTGLLFAETHRLVAQISQRYGIAPVAVHPALTLNEQGRSFGEKLWETDPHLCCTLRKVAPHRDLMRGYDAWITGIRRDQSPTRAHTEVVEYDASTESTKISPLAHWSEHDVWTYIRERDLPVNALHDGGYPSIGCIPCTRSIVSGEHPRAGRWSDAGKLECGLHAQVIHE